jgi:hypothetical protein
LKSPFNPSEYLSDEIVDGDGNSESLMSNEDLDSMVDNLLGLDEDEE